MDLIKKTENYFWGEEEQDAFSKAKPPILIYVMLQLPPICASFPEHRFQQSTCQSHPGAEGEPGPALVPGRLLW